MSSATEKEIKFSLEVMLSKDETKVLFAQVDSDFADVLLSFLTLPLGAIVTLLKQHYGDGAPVVGSLNTLYKSVENLDISHFWTDGGKQMLLYPRNSFEAECRKLKLNLNKTQRVKYFSCRTCDWYNSSNNCPEISMYYDTAKCRCGGTKNYYINFPKSNTKGADGNSDGVFAREGASFLLGDDLKMVPVVNGSIFQTLKNLGVTNIIGTKQTTVSFGLSEIMDLLRCSLLSHTPLTDLILHASQISGLPISVKIEQAGIFLHQIKKKESSSDSAMNLILKVIVQKSANKILFAHAEEDFIDFLFSLLTVPLGAVEFLLDRKTGIKCIDKLYGSIASMYESGENLNRYLKSTNQSGNSLVKPQLPPKYLCKSQLFSLTEQNSAPIYYVRETGSYVYYQMSDTGYMALVSDPKGQGSYVMGPRVYMVSDDLSVLPLSMSSTLSILNSMNVPLTDAEEVAINIGVQEGLGILKAALTSTCALTNGLSHIFVKQPEQEH